MRPVDPKNEMAWTVVIRWPGQKYTVEYYETEEEARGAGETAEEGGSVFAFVARILVQSR